MNNLKTILFMPEDIIIRQNEDSHHLYFINRGKVDVFHERLQVCKEYQKAHALKNKNNLIDQENNKEQSNDSPDKPDLQSEFKSANANSETGHNHHHHGESGKVKSGLFGNKDKVLGGVLESAE